MRRNTLSAPAATSGYRRKYRDRYISCGKLGGVGCERSARPVETGVDLPRFRHADPESVRGRSAVSAVAWMLRWGRTAVASIGKWPSRHRQSDPSRPSLHGGRATGGLPRSSLLFLFCSSAEVCAFLQGRMEESGRVPEDQDRTSWNRLVADQSSPHRHGIGGGGVSVLATRGRWWRCWGMDAGFPLLGSRCYHKRWSEYASNCSSLLTRGIASIIA